MGDGLGAGQTNTVVPHRERTGLVVVLDPDAKLAIPGQQLRVGQGEEPQFVIGVGGIRHQFTQEYLPVTVKRVNHQVQKLSHFCLEGPGFGLRGSRLRCGGAVGHVHILWSESEPGIWGRNGGKSSHAAVHHMACG